MATGYTAAIGENPNLTFKKFALNCARAMGYLISMRDDPADKPIPDEFPCSTYHLDEMKKAVKRLAETKKLSLDACMNKLIAAQIKNKKYHEDAIVKNDQLFQRYTAMLKQAKKYKAPSAEHKNFKEFMVSQITDSIEFDCNKDYHQKALKELEDTPYDAAAWKAEQIAYAERDIKYHEEQYAKDVESNKKKNTWLKLLRDSLK